VIEAEVDGTGTLNRAAFARPEAYLSPRRYRPWLMTFPPILISFSRRLVSDQRFTAFGIASVRMKCWAGGLSSGI
jgi:hypothetical protein